MENKSIWQYGIKSLKYNKLDKDIRCDVLIIGGGIAGLSCAYFLKNSKYKTVLVDKNMCGMGISARSTGKLTFMQDLIYNKIKDNYDEDKIRNKYTKVYQDLRSEILYLVSEFDCSTFDKRRIANKNLQKYIEERFGIEEISE